MTKGRGNPPNPAPWQLASWSHLQEIDAEHGLLPFWRAGAKGEQILADADALETFAKGCADPTATTPGPTSTDEPRGFPPAIVAFVDIVNSVGLGAALDEEHELLLRLLFRRCAALARETVWSSTFVFLDGDPFTAQARPRVFWYERFTGDGLLLCLQPWVEGDAPTRRPRRRDPNRPVTEGWGAGTYEDYRRRKRSVHLALDLAHRYARAIKLYWLRSPPNAKRIREGREPYGCAAAIHSGWVYWMAPRGRLQTWHGSGQDAQLEPDGVTISYAARLQEFARGPELANIVVSSEARGLAKRYRTPGFRYLEGREQLFRGLPAAQLVFGVQGLRVVPFLEDIDPSWSHYTLSAHRADVGSQLADANMRLPRHLAAQLNDIVSRWVSPQDKQPSPFSPGGDIHRKAHGRAALRQWGAIEFIYSLIFDADDGDPIGKLTRSPRDRDAPWGVNRPVRYRRLSAAYDLLRNTDLWRQRPWANALLAEVSGLLALYSGPLSTKNEAALLPTTQYPDFGTSSVNHHLTRADQYLKAAQRLATGSSRFDSLALTDAFGMVALLQQEAAHHDPDERERRHRATCDYLGQPGTFTRNALRCLTMMQASIALFQRASEPRARPPGSALLRPTVCSRDALAAIEGEFGRSSPAAPRGREFAKHLRRTLEALHSDRSRVHVLWTTLLLLESLAIGRSSSAGGWWVLLAALRKPLVNSLLALLPAMENRLLLLMNPAVFGHLTPKIDPRQQGMGLFELVSPPAAEAILRRHEGQVQVGTPQPAPASRRRGPLSQVVRRKKPDR
ncbi:MAG: hypothetical protein IT379_41955 [Deltaproteobacteria bacterium]|nr:hypothetical protein [Deltaproteobacteria bacterium]